MARLLAFVLVCLFAQSAAAAESAATTAARNVLAVQKDAWNRGDIDAFMQGYARSDAIRFAGGDRINYGWQATLDSYRKGYPDAAAMGKLDFELVEVRELSPVVVYVFGKWRLTRAKEAADKAPHGLFTLIVEKTTALGPSHGIHVPAGGWSGGPSRQSIPWRANTSAERSTALQLFCVRFSPCTLRTPGPVRRPRPLVERR